MKEEQANPKAS